MIGRTISQYRILERIGGGGMGVVYRAEDMQLGRDVALKFLPPALTDDASARERLLHEARAASALDHPNVCTVYEVGETDDGQVFLAMAYYEGRTLKQKIDDGPLPADELLELGVQIARALARAHGAGILHRDVKPANVIVTRHGDAKILDFGLARLADLPRLTQEGVTLGTPAYMSPEQLRGEDIDGRADLWSLGVMLYEMSTGRLPFRGAAAGGMAHAILHDEPGPPSRHRPELPGSFDELIGRLLQKDPGRRPSSAEEVAGILSGLRSTSGSLTTVLPAARATRRRHAALWAVPLALVAVAAATWLVLGRQPRSPAPPSVASGAGPTVAVLPFSFRGNEEYEYLGVGVVDLLGTKLDGAGDLRSVDTHALLSFLARNGSGSVDRRTAETVAGHFDAGLYLLGDILEAAGRLHLSASLYRSDEERPVGKASVEGEADRIFELVDRLAGELLAGQIERWDTGASSISAVTTASVPALKAYLRGEAAFRAGQFNASLDSYQEAVEADPQFALAWYRLSVAAEWATRLDVTASAAERAMELSERLSPHDRQLLQARVATRRGEAAEAERLYRAILGTWREDVEASWQLAEVLFHYGPWRGQSVSDSREAWERVLDLEPGFVQALWHVARVAGVEGNGAEVNTMVERILQANPEGERGLEMSALRAFALHDAGAERQVLDELSAAGDSVAAMATWNVSAFALDPEGAARVARLMTDPERSPDSRALGHIMIAWQEAARGRWQAAQGELGAAAQWRPGWALEHRALLALHPVAQDAHRDELREALVAWDADAEPPAALPTSFFTADDELHGMIRLYLLGRLAATDGDPAATRWAAELAGVAAASSAAALPADMAAAIRAHLARARGDDEVALRELGPARPHALYQVAISSPFVSLPAERFLRAALLERDEPEEALRWYSSFVGVSLFDLAFLAPAEYRRGLILERLGKAPEAAAAFRRFLDLWRDCDPGLREQVRDAEARLAALEGAGGV